MNKKKLLALLMALVMTLTLVPVTAFATEATHTELAVVSSDQNKTGDAYTAWRAAKDDAQYSTLGAPEGWGDLDNQQFFMADFTHHVSTAHTSDQTIQITAVDADNDPVEVTGFVGAYEVNVTYGTGMLPLFKAEAGPLYWTMTSGSEATKFFVRGNPTYFYIGFALTSEIEKDTTVTLTVTRTGGDKVVGNTASVSYTFKANASEETSVAQIGNVKYETLEAAFANAQDGDTITLLANCSGNGIIVPQGKFPTGLTVDFGGFTYDISGKPVGSTGTETIGMQLLKGNKLTFKNGTLYSDCTQNPRDGRYLQRLIQNYSDLTLDNMTISMKGAYYNQATMSTCNGTTNIINGSVVEAPDFTDYEYSVAQAAKSEEQDGLGAVALLVGTFNGYTTAAVANISDSTIVGNVKVSYSNSNSDEGGAILNLNNAVLTDGSIVMGTNADKATVTKAESSTLAAPAGYTWSAAVNGVKTLVKQSPVAKIGDVEYTSLQSAITAAQTGDTINIIADFAIPETNTAESDRIIVNKSVTIDFGEYTMSVPGTLGDDTSNNWVGLYIQGNDVNVTLTGTTGGIDCLDNNDESGAYSFYVKDGATVTVNGGHYHGGGTVGQVAAGTLIINDGYFKVTDYSGDYSGYRYVLNCIDSYYNSGTAKIAVKGGTFENFDPSNCLAEGANTNFVADGYEAVALSGDDAGKWQVGKVTATELNKDKETAADYDATYTATKTVTSTDGSNETLKTNDTIKVNVKGTDEETVSTTAAATAPASLNNIKSMQDFVETVTSKTGDAETVNVTIQLAKGAGDTSETGKIVYEVHPEAIITVSNSDESTTVALTNDQITGSFSFKLYVPTTVAAVNGKVTVIHKHADSTTEENLGTFTVADDHTITLTGVSSFSEFELTGTDENSVTVSALGASLRRRVKTNDKSRVVNTSTDFRMTYQWTLPSGVSLDTTEGACYFLWSKDNGATWKKVNITDFDGNTASIVINGIPRAAFDTTIKTKIHLEYTGDSSGNIEVTGYDRSVNYVANELTKMGIGNAWGAYGYYLLATGGTYIVYPNGSISYSE